jgi:hypothetical protein
MILHSPPASSTTPATFPVAIRNLALKPIGRSIVMMFYRSPHTLSDFGEINGCEHFRRKLRPMSFEARKEALIWQFDPYLAHDWFDMTFPLMNDFLTLPEMVKLLQHSGFQNVRSTVEARNVHNVADRIEGTFY